MSSGYISEALRDRIEAQAKSRCGYCRNQQKYVLGTLEIAISVNVRKAWVSVGWHPPIDEE